MPYCPSGAVHHLTPSPESSLRCSVCLPPCPLPHLVLLLLRTSILISQQRSLLGLHWLILGTLPQSLSLHKANLSHGYSLYYLGKISHFLYPDQPCGTGITGPIQCMGNSRPRLCIRLAHQHPVKERLNCSSVRPWAPAPVPCLPLRFPPTPHHCCRYQVPVGVDAFVLFWSILRAAKGLLSSCDPELPG